jgi:diguanylate cyclase (GGDEF)-like protein
MDLDQDVLLPVLFAVIAANVAIVGLLFAASRIGRGRSVVPERGPAPMAPTADSVARDRAVAYAAAVESEGRDPTPIGVVPDSDEPDGTAGDDAADEGAEARDALTGLLDATAFSRVLTLEDARLQRYHRPATIVVFDLDGLDRLTTLLGPAAAERVLPAVADTIRRLARDADVVARLGEARFGALLPETDEIAAINYVERVRRACELWLDAGAIALQFAIGWAGTSGDPTLHQASRLAHERMYAERRRHARRSEDAAPEAEETGRIAS